MTNQNSAPQTPQFPTNPFPAPAPTQGKVTAPPRPTSPDVQKPGFGNARGPATAPDVARSTINGRKLPGKIYKPSPLPQTPKAMAAAASGQVKALMGGSATNTVKGPNSIAELARALKNDPQLIYEFVANNIEFLPTYGLQKGGLGALIDGCGNAFDQADLMVQLLTQAGYTARYVSGEIRLWEADWRAWLNTDNNAWAVWSAVNLLGNGGIPVTPTWDTTNYVWYIDVSHVWVKVTIGGTDYYFDPARKTYTNTTGVNLATATGYNQTTLLSDAASGATINANYAKNWHNGNINSSLNTYTGNLVSWLKANMPGAKLEDIVGGRAINKVTIPLLQTSISYVKPGTTPTVWTTIPDAYKTTMQVQYDWNGSGFNIDQTFFSADIHAKRLSLWFNGSLQVELTLDGTVVDTSSAQGAGSWNSVLITIEHAYPSTFADQATWYTLWAGQRYVIAHAWGNGGREQSIMHQRALDAAIFAGGSASAENVLGQSLTAIWHGLNGQACLAADLLGRLTNGSAVYHHQVGLIYHNGGPGVDLGQVLQASNSLECDADKAGTLNTALCMHGVAMEEGVITQMTQNTSTNATRLICEANALGQEVYIADSTNWTGSVRPNLINYSTTDLNNIESWYINSGWRVFIPKNGATAVDSFTGYGYMAVPITPYSGAVGIIAGSLKGSVPTASQSTTDTNDETNKKKKGDDKNEGTFGDPVGNFQGNFVHHATDLELGTGDFPYSLSFERNYDSNGNISDGPLGLGWRHNHGLTAKSSGDGFLALGLESPLEAAAAITELYVATQLLSDQTRPLNKFLTALMATQWLMNQIKNNVVRITLPDHTETYVKLPDGSYTSPRAVASTLTLVSSLYVLTTPQGVQYNFDASGNISTIVYPFGVTVTFTYTSGKLTSVANGMGRTLTLSYSGDRITSVSDGTGRSVSYSVSGSKLLTSFTDANGQATTYGYTTDGRMEKMYLPENPATTILTNVYDTLGRVKQQTLVAGGTYNFYFAGSRSEIVDPNSKSKIVYFDRMGNALISRDELGKDTVCLYDGRQRLTRETLPEGNRREYTYDGKNNLLTVTRVAKSGSGLSNLVTTYTYSSTWNKVASVTDPRGNVTSYTYSGTTGLLTQVTYPAIGGVSATISMTYTSRGQLQNLTDQLGVVRRHTYNATTEVLETVTADYGTGKLNLVTTYAYDSVGNITSVTDPRSKVTTRTFDTKRQMTQTTSPSPLSYDTQMVYDKNGNVTQVKRETGVGGTPWQIYATAYNAANLPTSATDPLSHVVTMSYDSMRRLSSVTDALGRVTSSVYDELSRLKKKVDAAGNDAATAVFSDNGVQNSAKDSRSKTTTRTLDGHDRIITITYADSTTESFTYDACGNITGFTNRAGASTSYTYDALNRLVGKSPSGQSAVTYEYDLVGRIKKSATTVVSGNPATGNFTYTYDNAGRMKTEVSPDGKTVSYDLDANGNVTKITYPDGYYVSREYDEMNRLTKVKLNGSSSAALTFDYDALSRRTKITYGNGVVTNYAYHWDDTVDTIQHVFSGSSVTFDYGYNAGMEATSLSVSDSNYMWHPSAGGTVTYATAGNANTYPTVGGVSYSYNSNGALTSDGTWTYTYDTEQHLISGTNGSTTVSFVYDGQHRQIQKTVGSTKTRYIYSGWQRIADYNGASGALQNRFVYGVGLDEPLIIVSSGGTVTYLHHDKMGTLVATSGSAGTVSNKNKIGPFGEVGSLAGTCNFGFTGQRYDSELSLYYFKRRYYSPKLGRFLQADPLGFTDSSLHLYTYANNNPLRYTDPMGLEADYDMSPYSPQGTPILDGEGNIKGYSDGMGGMTSSPGGGNYLGGSGASLIPQWGSNPNSTDPDGNSVVVNPDGSTTYYMPDGSILTVFSDQSTQTINPNGSVATTSATGTVLGHQGMDPGNIMNIGNPGNVAPGSASPQ